MAITFRGEVGYAEYFDASNSTDLVLGSITDGDTVIIWTATGCPDEVIGSFTLTDPTGNTWVEPFSSITPGSDYVAAPEYRANGLAKLGCFVCYSASGLSGATLTFTRSFTPSGTATADEHARVIRAMAFSPLTSFPTPETDDTNGSSTSSSVGFNSGGGFFSTGAHQVAIGAVAWTGRSGSDGYTAPAGWADRGFDGTNTGRTLPGDGYSTGGFGVRNDRYRDHCLALGYRLHTGGGTSFVGFAGTITPGGSPVDMVWEAKMLLFWDGSAPSETENETASKYAVDLVQTARGCLHRAHRDSGAIKTSHSRDAGATWSSEVTVASDARSPGAVGTLCRLPSDDLLCLYHNSSDAAVIYYSRDYGATWTLRGTHTAVKKYPRAVCTKAGLIVACHTGTAVEFFRDASLGGSLGSSVSSVTMPEQLVALRVDANELLHLYYTDGTSILYRYSDNYAASWSSASTLVTGKFPAVSLGIGHALLSFWASGALGLRLLRGGSYDAAESTPGATPAGLEQTWHGLLHNHGQVIYLAGKDASFNVDLHYTRDEGAAWAVPS